MTRDGPAQTEATATGTGRALVFVERRAVARLLPRIAADFLTQLIASNRRLGEYRRAGRRDPAAGTGEYRAARPQHHPPAFERQV